jgi:hypothetical protein
LAEVADARPTEHAAKCFFGIGSLVMMGLGIVANNPVAFGSGAIMAGTLVLSRVIVDLRSGVSSSNWGTWQRNENRLGFRCNVSFWGVITLLWFALGSLAMLDLIRLPSS